MNPDSGYVVIENFLTNDEADFLCKYALDNDMGDEARPTYGFFPLGGSDLMDGSRELDFDPTRIKDAINFALSYFKENYTILGELVLNRAHFNIMYEGALLDDHADEDPNSMGNYDKTKRSYILGIFLNDDYKGGKFSFEDQDALFVPPKGSLVLFPGWCTRHGVKEVREGARVNILVVFHDILPKS